VLNIKFPLIFISPVDHQNLLLVTIGKSALNIASKK
jgi:hypothetical protein